MILINWSAFNTSQELQQMRCILMFFIVFAIVINLIVVGGNSKIDQMGHIGGAITGLVWGMAFFPRVRTDSGRKLKMIGLVGVLGFFVLFTALLFTN
mgnify:CR=1 FL=1